MRSTNDHLNHIKDMHEVQDIQPRPLNHVCCRGVEARAGSVHLMYSSNEWQRPEWKGRVSTPRTTPSCSYLTDNRKPTESPQTQHSLDSINNDVSAFPPPHPQHNYTTYFLHNHQHFTSRPSSSRTLHVIASGSLREAQSSPEARAHPPLH